MLVYKRSTLLLGKEYVFKKVLTESEGGKSCDAMEVKTLDVDYL